jgi:hypothetical protein
MRPREHRRRGSRRAGAALWRESWGTSSETEHRAAGSQQPDPRRFTPRAEQHWESRAARRMKRERGKAEASAAPEGTSAAAAGSRGSEWWEAIPIPTRSLAGGGRQEAGAPATERNKQEKCTRRMRGGPRMATVL